MAWQLADQKILTTTLFASVTFTNLPAEPHDEHRIVVSHNGLPTSVYVAQAIIE
jgi:hypothetical protein